MDTLVYLKHLLEMKSINRSVERKLHFHGINTSVLDHLVERSGNDWLNMQPSTHEAYPVCTEEDVMYLRKRVHGAWVCDAERARLGCLPLRRLAA